MVNEKPENIIPPQGKEGYIRGIHIRDFYTAAAWIFIVFAGVMYTVLTPEQRNALNPLSHLAGSSAAAINATGSVNTYASFGDLQWKPGDLHNQTPFTAENDYTAITQTLSATAPAHPVQQVTLGFNEKGGGFLWSAVLNGFSQNGYAGNMGYGGGLIGALRDQMHNNRYNPIQSGVNYKVGAPTTVVQGTTSVLVPQFQAPLYSDGSAGKNPLFPISNYRSEFDFSGITKNVSPELGVIAFERDLYYAYARVPAAVKQFLSGNVSDGSAVFQSSKRIKDISSLPGTQTPADTDLSYTVLTSGGVRPTALFNHMFYYQGGMLKEQTLSTAILREEGNAFTCEIALPKDGRAYVYANSGTLVNAGDSGCVLDIPLIIFSTSANPSQGTAMALYLPEQDAWNSQQLKVVDSTTLNVPRTEDRRMRSFIFVTNFTDGGQINPGGFWWAAARSYLSGMLSPTSAATAYGMSSLEAVTEKTYILYGTPNEILDAVKLERGIILPTISITATAPSVTRGGSTKGEYVVTRTGLNAAPLTVPFVLSGSASLDSDYTLLGATGNSITIPAGASSARVSLVPSGGTSTEPETAILTLQGGARYQLGTSTATITLRDDAAAVGYDVVLIIGQSNAVGRGLGASTENPIYVAKASEVFQLGRFGSDNNKVIPATEPLQHWGQTPGTNLEYKGWAYPLGLRLATLAQPGRKILLIPAARGSTSILQWDNEVQGFTNGIPDSTLLYDDMLARLKTALALNTNNRLVAVVWDQGEADVLALANPRSNLAGFMTSGTLYQQKLEWLRAELRAAVPTQRCFPFVVVGMSKLWDVNGLANGPQARTELLSAQKAAVASDACQTSLLADTNSFTTIHYNTDLLHFSAEGARIMGNRIFVGLKPLIGTQ